MKTTKPQLRIWQGIVTFLQQQPDVYVGKEAACRQFIEAVLWMTRSGAQWRLLPQSYGNWNSIYARYNRWSKRGIWRRMQQSFVEFADLEKRAD